MGKDCEKIIGIVFILESCYVPAAERVLQFVRSLRIGDCGLYEKSLQQIIILFFVIDQPNYS